MAETLFNPKSKKSIRILVSRECNYMCSYCCNEIPAISEAFVELAASDIANAIDAYDILVVTGGEPLIEENLESTKGLVDLAKYLDKTVIVYTNLSTLPDEELVRQVNGWTVGYHIEETDLFTFAARVEKLVKMGAKSIRVNVDAVLPEAEVLGNLIGMDKLHPYQLNDCNRSEIEDIYILKAD